ncbi:hypothetical protein BC629DRAFT_1632520 [Irpex lacteus]|nr:hypothetical protein BC629DRAFT_1632520 [Irpex lacteus]
MPDMLQRSKEMIGKFEYWDSTVRGVLPTVSAKSEAVNKVSLNNAAQTFYPAPKHATEENLRSPLSLARVWQHNQAALFGISRPERLPNLSLNNAETFEFSETVFGDMSSLVVRQLLAGNAKRRCCIHRAVLQKDVGDWQMFLVVIATSTCSPRYVKKDRGTGLVHMRWVALDSHITRMSPLLNEYTVVANGDYSVDRVVLKLGHFGRIKLTACLLGTDSNCNRRGRRPHGHDLGGTTPELSIQFGHQE